jgi:glycerophosphoryl diester phosphodiesterase
VHWLVARGVDGVELDVRRTRDEVLVVHHDAEWDGLPVARTEYRDLVRSGSRPRTLEEVLAAAQGRLALDIELKETGYEAGVVSMVLAHAEPERVVVTSFLDEAVRAVKSQTSVRAGLIVGRTAAVLRPRALLADVFPFARLRRCGADFLAPNLRLLAAGLGRRAQRRGIPLLLWGVDDDELIRRYLREPGLIGVVTESPRALAEPPAAEDAVGWPFEQVVPAER